MNGPRNVHGDPDCQNAPDRRHHRNDIPSGFPRSLTLQKPRVIVHWRCVCLPRQRKIQLAVKVSNVLSWYSAYTEHGGKLMAKWPLCSSWRQLNKVQRFKTWAEQTVEVDTYTLRKYGNSVTIQSFLWTPEGEWNRRRPWSARRWESATDEYYGGGVGLSWRSCRRLQTTGSFGLSLL